MTVTKGKRIRVTTLSSFVHAAWAECNGCDWEVHPERSPSWPATRERSRRHAAKAGHVVTAGYRVMRDYGVIATRPPAPDPNANARHCSRCNMEWTGVRFPAACPNCGYGLGYGPLPPVRP